MFNIKIKTPEGILVHAAGADNNDHTLCGLTMSSDSYMGIEEATIVSNRIDCPQCKQIIKHCKSIPNFQIQK